KSARQVKNSDNKTAFATSSASLTENKCVMPSRVRNTRNAMREETNAMAQYSATGGQPSSDDSTGALRIHKASNGEINAQKTSKAEKRTAKDPRDTGDLLRISIFLSEADRSYEFKAPCST